MPRRKKTKPEEGTLQAEKGNGSSNGLVGPRVHEGELYFSKEDLSRFELAQYKVANTLQGIQIKKNQVSAIRRKAEQDIAQVQAEIVALQHTVEKLKMEFSNLRQLVEKEYGLDLSESGRVTYDDETGRIYDDGHPVLAAQ